MPAVTGPKAVSDQATERYLEPAAPELIAFVKALARDLARADAAAFAANVAASDRKEASAARADDGSRGA